MASSEPPQNASEHSHYEHPAAGHAKKKRRGPWLIEPINAFGIFLAANIVAAVLAPIQDCDETFNYWEPMHYLSHGYGLQTWEYSPEFAIRSWTYIVLHAIVGNFRRILPQSTKVAEFYFVRYSLAFVCALCQTIMYQVTSSIMNGRIGLLFLMATVLSPGNFHASTAFLPSSFAMYASMLGASAFMNWRGGPKTSQGIFWFAIASVLGWPFAAALSFPYVVEEGILAVFGGMQSFKEASVRTLKGCVWSFVVIAVDCLVNFSFYRERELVFWNIVRYNVFSSTGGPDLYGTEPWHFYVKNLTLNFNIWFPLAAAALPLFLLQKLISPSGHGFGSGLRTVVFVSPFYLWLAIFSAQVHKEERFMYPAYPFLALNAAISLHIVLTAVGNPDPKSLMGKIPAHLKLLSVTSVLLLSASIGMARIYGTWSAYSAPLSVYSPLHGSSALSNDGIGKEGDTVCFGKEWYRFPTSYFLPQGVQAKFVRSEFRGLLPGEFAKSEKGSWLWSGTWVPTHGLNDNNQEDMGKYVDIRQCSFLVDTQYPERSEPLPPSEPDYIADEKNWSVVKCVAFLDAASTPTLARTLWTPDLSLVPESLRRKWGRHCLLQKIP